MRKDKGGGSQGSSPGHSRRAHSQPNSASSSPGKNGMTPNGGGGGSRSKGVPQSFGYIKRQANGSMASNIVTMDAQQHLMLNPQQQQQQHQGNRTTAQVSAVPRGGKMKMSPGANQTQDLHTSKTKRVAGYLEPMDN